MAKHKFIFGVFNAGRLVFRLGTAVECTHDQASAAVLILETAQAPLQAGHYLAYDYAEAVKL